VNRGEIVKRDLQNRFGIDIERSEFLFLLTLLLFISGFSRREG